MFGKKFNIALMLVAVCCCSVQMMFAQTTATDTATTRVKLETTAGNIVVKLYNETPQHRDNFIKLVKEHYYDSVLFHRVIKNFMIQTGDPVSKKAGVGEMLGSGGPDYTIPAEIVYPKYFHKRGALAAARTSDMVNPERRSSGSQFYIVTGQVWSSRQLQGLAQQMSEQTGKPVRFTDAQIEAYTTVGGAPHLDGQYTVFGEVVDGMDVVNKIEDAETDTNDRPVQNVRIIKAAILP